MPLIQSVLNHIQELVEQEHRFHGQEAMTDEDRARLHEVQVELDQCWDLLRQRRALRGTGQDPDKRMSGRRTLWRSMSSKIIRLVVTGAVSSVAVAGDGGSLRQSGRPIAVEADQCHQPYRVGTTGGGADTIQLAIYRPRALLNSAACGFWAWVYQPGRRSSEQGPGSLVVSAGRSRSSRLSPT